MELLNDSPTSTSDHPQEGVMSVLDHKDASIETASSHDAEAGTAGTGDNAAVKPANADEPTVSTLSRRAKKRLIRNQRMRARLEEQKLARRMNKSTSPSKQLDSLNNDRLAETTYYYENGLRKVYPYHFTFTTHAKGRWYGRSILDVFTEEFESTKLGDFREAIERGRITVNGQAVKTDYKLSSNDIVRNTLHRHEVPVTAESIQIIEDSNDVLVVNKPSSIPVHPCGRYRHNSLTFILAKEHGYQNLRTSYRLDRLTSGVFILMKTEAKNQEFHTHMKNREVQKEYVCRVEGTFPEGTTECRDPLEVLSHRLGLYKVGAGGKEAWTTFERLSCSGDNSVVKCKPHTGRTHQIRVHLQYLGYPIVNDPLYNSEIWGSCKGKGGNYGKPEEQLIQELLANHNSEKYRTTDGDDGPSNIDTSGRSPLNPGDSLKRTDAGTPSRECSDTCTADASDEACQDPPCKRPKISDSPDNTGIQHPEEADNDTGACDAHTSQTDKCSGDSGDLQRPGFDPAKMTVDPYCMECQKKYQDPSPEDLVMYLHAYRYKGPTWEYSTELPTWAREDWKSS